MVQSGVLYLESSAMPRPKICAAAGLILGLVGVSAPAVAQTPQSICEDKSFDINADGIVNNVDQGICFGCAPGDDDECWVDCGRWDLDGNGMVGFSDVGLVTLECANWAEIYTPMEVLPEEAPAPAPVVAPPTPTAALTGSSEAGPIATPGGTATPTATPASTMTPGPVSSAKPTAPPRVAPSPPPPPSSSGWVTAAVSLAAAIAASGAFFYIRWWRARWRVK
jgi:hypothetical protein